MARTRRLTKENLSETNRIIGEKILSKLKRRVFGGKKEAVDKAEPNFNEHVDGEETEFTIGSRNEPYKTFLRFYYGQKNPSSLYFSLEVVPPKIKGGIEKTLSEELPKEQGTFRDRGVKVNCDKVCVEYRVTRMPLPDEYEILSENIIPLWQKIMKALV